MNHDLAISVRNVGKSYSIFHDASRQTTLGEAMLYNLRHGFRRLEKETFWALNDISFDVRRGEVVGIIGRNGAGKSTLLKILSRITELTRGEVDLHGRVGSLLEIGTGFHPELTGRENIFLNGAILGMKRAEIQKRFDEIVAFAEVERFLDTPVKRYSSGMYVRLAFAVAAHLETEILIVDEVLAVGDVKFQQKCLGRMGEVAAREGRTVLFVSHNMPSVQQLCTSCRLIEAGRLAGVGKPVEIIGQYLQMMDEPSRIGGTIARHPACEVQLRILDADGKPADAWCFGRPLVVEVSIELKRMLWKPAVDIAFYDEKRNRLFAFQSDRLGEVPDQIGGSWVMAFKIENPGLTLDRVTLDVGIREGPTQYFAMIPDAARLSIDHATVPSGAASGCIMHPCVSLQWRKGGPPE
jgi:lipopolysaccharide transport system ATP-binding protein